MQLKSRIDWVLLELKDEGKRISKQWLADQLGVSRQMLSLYISGKSYPPLDKAFHLAKLLNRKVEDLWVEEKNNGET